MKFMENKLPIMFIGHGSPMNAIEENDFTISIKKVAESLPEPKAIMMISAHWTVQSTMVNTQEHPKQIYDFYGFPRELFEFKYNCKGSPEFSQLVIDTLGNYKIKPTSEWGIDHGSWTILKHIYPNANIPVFQLSLDMTKDAKWHYELGKELRKLRDLGVLIIGSGDIVHNLGAVGFEENAKPYDWAVEFDDIVKDCLVNKNHDKLIDYKSIGNSAIYSIPTSEHYLPLLYIIGLQEENEMVEFIYEGIQNKSISLTSFIVK